MSKLVALSFLLLLTYCSSAHVGPAIAPQPARAPRTAGTQALDSYDQVVFADSPIAYWPLNDLTGNVAHDAWGNHDGTIGSGLTLGAASILPAAPGSTAIAFPGGAQTGFTKAIVVAQNSALQPTAAISTEGWLQSSHFKDGTESTGTMWMYGNDASIEPWIYVWRWDGVSQTFLRFYVTRASDHTQTFVESSVAMQNWVPTHVVGTYDGANIKLYINGALVGAKAFAGTLDYSNMGSFGITMGLRNTVKGDFGGRLQKMALYNYALSASQVYAHYVAGTSASPTPSPSPTASPSPRPSPSPSPTPSSNDPYDQTVLGDSPIAYWPLNDLNGSVAHDAWGNKDGTIGSALTLGAASVLPADPGSTAISFPGGIQTGYTKAIVVPQNSALQPTAAISTEGWLECSHFSDGTESTGTMWMYGDDTYNEPWIYVWRWDGVSKSFLRFYVTRASDHSQTFTESSVAMQNNVPTHVVGTYDGANIKLYINGALVGTKAFAGTLDYSSVGNFGITMGLRNTIVGDYGGRLQKMALYSYALSASQVNAHYAAGAGGP